MDKVLVKKAVSAQYPVGAGAPIMVLGGGGRGGRARTLRESAGGLAGGALGALGALAGQHRSLGSLVQSGISGAAQGGAIGRGLGRVFVGPESQARANLRQEMADKYAAARASGEFDRYGISSSKTPRTRIGVMLAGQGNDSMMGRRLYELEQAKQAEKDMLAQQRAEEIAAAQARGKDFGTRQMKDAEAMEAFRRDTGLDPNIAASQFMGPLGAAISQQQNQQQQGGQPGGVDAAGRPVQVITPNTPVNTLPAPLTVPTVGQEIGNEEQTPTGDMVDHDGEYQTFGQEPDEGSGVTDAQIASLQASAAKLGRQVGGNMPQGNRQPDEEKFKQTTLF